MYLSTLEPSRCLVTKYFFICLVYKNINNKLTYFTYISQYRGRVGEQCHPVFSLYGVIHSTIFSFYFVNIPPYLPVPLLDFFVGLPNSFIPTCFFLGSSDENSILLCFEYSSNILSSLSVSSSVERSK